MMLTALAVWMSSAWAGGADWEAEAPVPDPHGAVTVAVAPLRLDQSMLDMSIELRASDTRSLVLSGAFGAAENVGKWELGGQIRDYVVGNFDNGVLLGAQVLREQTGRRGKLNMRTSFGPFIGAKMTLAIFSIEARTGLGVAYSREAIHWQPLMDVRAGITF